MNSRQRLVLLILALFFFRFLFGLFQAKWHENDEFQTYLIGLKQYTTQTWPYFGPDLTGSETTFTSQIPGALEGLLIGLSFKVLPIPEAPFITLNLLSMAGVVLLAWYIKRRLPVLSFAWLLVWIGCLPWSLNEGTHIINPAFLLFPSVLFFIGFLETLSFTRLGVVPFWLANSLMGFSIVWSMQFHTSYIYLVPLALISLVLQFKECRFSSFIYLVLGALPMVALVIPTYLQYGLSKGGSALGFVAPFNWGNLENLFVILARYISLVCLEMPRFIDTNTKTRIAFLTVHWWLFVPGAILWILGLIQPFFLLWSWFRNKREAASWVPLKWITFLCFLMVFASFWFTLKSPLAHIYFIFFPLLMIYSCDCYVSYVQDRRWALFAKVIIVLCVYFHLGYAFAVVNTNSFYPEREKIVKAIQDKDYHLLGDRYPGSSY